MEMLTKRNADKLSSIYKEKKKKKKKQILILPGKCRQSLGDRVV